MTKRSEFEFERGRIDYHEKNSWAECALTYARANLAVNLNPQGIDVLVPFWVGVQVPETQL